MIGDALMLAAIGDILGILVPIVFFIIYVLNQLLSAKGGRQQPGRNPKRQPGRPAERPMQPAQPQRKPKGGAAQLNTEIEQFLKRASQRRGQQPARARAASAPPVPKPAPKSFPPPASGPAKEKPADVVPIEKRDFDEVAASVQKHMGTERFESRAAHLGDDVVEVDDAIEQHLQKVFHHRLGKLGGETASASEQGADVQTVVVTDAPSPAAAFAQLLRTPQGMRQAIVVSEILTRPADRW